MPKDDKPRPTLPASGSPCTGCGLCMSVCGQRAISMEENAEGFLVAKVDEAACIGCKACEKMCARLAKVGGSGEHRFYEAWSQAQEIRCGSSSGGVFREQGGLDGASQPQQLPVLMRFSRCRDVRLSDSGGDRPFKSANCVAFGGGEAVLAPIGVSTNRTNRNEVDSNH